MTCLKCLVIGVNVKKNLVVLNSNFFDNEKFTNYWVFSNQCYKRMQQLNIATVNSHCCMGHACGRIERSLIVNDHKVISDAYHT